MSTINYPTVGNCNLQTLPQECPFCHRSIQPLTIYACMGLNLQVFFQCPHPTCKSSFVGYYDKIGNIYSLISCSKGNILNFNFKPVITEISPNFIIIYNQAFYAEQESLYEICGVGYRKALEFLIKDYLIGREPEKKEEIEKNQLGKCIAEHITDANIKSVSKRAVWLGNDETHYVRKWEGKNLNDLKKLIELTIHWMEIEALTKSFEEDMPG
jgi:hypothetical protein